MLMDGLRLAEGTTITNADGSTKIGAIYDIAGSTISQPTDAAILMRFSVNRDFAIPQVFTDSFAESTVAPTGSPVYSIKRNGVEIGTITFTVNAGAFAAVEGSDHAFVVGDILTVEAPATADATHDELSWTISANIA